MKKDYEFLLFDYDGCLAKTLEVWLAAYHQVFADYQITPSDAEITSKVFGDWEGALKLGLKSEYLSAFTEKLLQIVEQNLTSVALYDQVYETISQLKSSGKKLAVLSTSKLATVEPGLTNHNLVDFFETIITAEDVSKHKPDPEIIELALRRLGGTKDQAVMIGDSKSDLGAALNAGIDSILFYPPSHQTFYDLEKLKTFRPTYQVGSFLELLGIIS